MFNCSSPDILRYYVYDIYNFNAVAMMFQYDCLAVLCGEKKYIYIYIYLYIYIYPLIIFSACGYQTAAVLSSKLVHDYCSSFAVVYWKSTAAVSVCCLRAMHVCSTQTLLQYFPSKLLQNYCNSFAAALLKLLQQFCSSYLQNYCRKSCSY